LESENGALESERDLNSSLSKSVVTRRTRERTRRSGQGWNSPTIGAVTGVCRRNWTSGYLAEIVKRAKRIAELIGEGEGSLLKKLSQLARGSR